MNVGIVSSSDAPHDAGFVSFDDGDTYSTLASPLEYSVRTLATNGERDDGLLLGNSDALAISDTETARLGTADESDNELDERQADGELQGSIQDEQDNVADLDYQAEDGFALDSDSESDHSVTSGQAEVDDHHDENAESNLLYAKEFLEKTWNHFCDCREEENMERGEQPVLNLEQMAGYWKTLGVPDSISPTPPINEANEERAPRLEWVSILNGGDNRPNLDIERSQISPISIDRTWDIDSIFSWASCLSINRGLYNVHDKRVSQTRECLKNPSTSPNFIQS
jgi:hypothetical protein